MGKFDTTILKGLLSKVSGNKDALKHYLSRLPDEEFSLWRLAHYRHNDIENEADYGIDRVKVEVENRSKREKIQAELRASDAWVDNDYANAVRGFLISEDLMDEDQDVYNLYLEYESYRGRLEIYGYGKREYAVCRESDAKDIHKEAVEDYIDNEGMQSFKNELISCMDGEKVANYFDYTIDEMVRNEPDYYLEGDDRSLSDDQEERIREIEQEIRDLEQEQEGLDMDDSEQELRYEEIDSEMDDLRSEQADIESSPDGDWSDDKIESAAEELKEKVKNNPYSYIIDWGYMDDEDPKFLYQFVNKEKFIDKIVNQEDMGFRFANADSTQHNYRYNGEEFLIFRTQ